MTETIFIPEHLLYKNYVSPNLCHELAKLGLPGTNMFNWVVKGKQVKLESRAFDYDNYYNDAVDIINKTNPPDYIINAYSLMDIIGFCPEFSMATINKKYRMSGLLIDTYEQVEHARLPDCFAEYLKILLQKGVLLIN